MLIGFLLRWWHARKTFHRGIEFKKEGKLVGIGCACGKLFWHDPMRFKP
jgi:hypothetical protein